MLTTSGNLNKQIIRLAWPVVLQNLGRSIAIAILDTFWIGKLGPEFLAAVTVGSFLSWGVFALAEMMPIGTNALVSQAVGAKETDTAKNIGSLNLFNAVLLGLLIAIVIYPLRPLLYNFTNISAIEAGYANLYFLPILILLPSIILFETGSAIFRGNGNTKTPFWLLIIVYGMKVILTPLLIFSFKLGITGASLATMISYGLTFLLELFLLKRNNLIHPLRKKFLDIIHNIKYHLKVTFQSVKIGLPLSLEGLTFSFIYIFVTRYVADFGTIGLAALGIGHRSEAIPYQLGDALGITTSIIVGQNIGAQNIDRAEKGAWRVLLLSWVPIIFYSFILFFFPEQVAGIFTDDKGVIETAKVYNMIAAFSIFFSMSETIFAGAFAGAGNSLPPLAIYLPLTAMRIPLCAFFAPIYGMNGIWIAIFSTSIVKGIMIAFWFKLGRWKTRKFVLANEPREAPIEVGDVR